MRTIKTQEKFEKLVRGGLLSHGCNLCKETKVVKKFKYWRILQNKFPWDRVAKIDHLIATIRHETEKKLSSQEKKEFQLIKSRYIEKNYEYIMEPVNKAKSIPRHFHLHLIKTRNKAQRLL